MSLLVIHASSCSGGTSVPSGYAQRTSGTKYYKFITPGAPYMDAKQICWDDGARLALLQTEDDVTDVQGNCLDSQKQNLIATKELVLQRIGQWREIKHG